jgi:hypothetical protein
MRGGLVVNKNLSGFNASLHGFRKQDCTGLCRVDGLMETPENASKVQAYNNFITVSNKIRGTGNTYENIKLWEDAHKQLEAAFGSSRWDEIAKSLSQDQLDQFMYARNTNECVQPNLKLDPNFKNWCESGGPIINNDGSEMV